MCDDRPALGIGIAVRLAVLPDVSEYMEGFPVELWNTDTGRVVVRAYNECTYNYTDIDLGDLLACLSGESLAGMPECQTFLKHLSPLS